MVHTDTGADIINDMRFFYKFHVVFSNNGNGHGVYINNSPLNRIRRIYAIMQICLEAAAM